MTISVEPFQKGDLIRLTRPQAPIPSHWPKQDFGIGSATWNAFKDHIYQIHEVVTYNSCLSVLLSPTPKLS